MQAPIRRDSMQIYLYLYIHASTPYETHVFDVQIRYFSWCKYHSRQCVKTVPWLWLEMLWMVQANVKVYNTTNMNAIGSCWLYHHIRQALIFNLADVEGSVLLRCAGTLALGLVLRSDNLTKRFPFVPGSSSAKLTDIMFMQLIRKFKMS